VPSFLHFIWHLHHCYLNTDLEFGRFTHELVYANKFTFIWHVNSIMKFFKSSSIELKSQITLSIEYLLNRSLVVERPCHLNNVSVSGCPFIRKRGTWKMFHYI
jgi:hypothetical protein